MTRARSNPQSDRLKSARRLLARIGCTDHTLTRLAGGANNQVYRVDCRTSKLVLKLYSTHPDDRRDRLGAEYPFSEFAWKHGIRCIPQPIACDKANRLAAYSYVPGRKLSRTEVTTAAARQAARFFVRLNRLRRREGAADLPDASEACFSIDAHLRLVAGRVERLKQIEPADKVDDQAARFVRRELTPVARCLLSAAGQRAANPDSDIAAEDRCISPSDFGFHNALRRPNGRIAFLDFEYAGWDDPAKTVCDFFCQPRYPAPMQSLKSFIDELRGQFPQHHELVERIHFLLPVYRIKWCCIMLNEFLPAGRHRRLLAQNTVDEAAARRRQLQQAREALRHAQRSTNKLKRAG
jgi:hypothetical protein